MEDGIERNTFSLNTFKTEEIKGVKQETKEKPSDNQLNKYLYICIPENGSIKNCAITDDIKKAMEHLTQNKCTLEIFKQDNTSGFYKTM